MKCDGHAKLTESALQLLVSKCEGNPLLTQSLCRSYDFQSGSGNEGFKDKNNSIPDDNTSLAIKIILGQFNPFSSPVNNKFKGHLTTRTVAIDLDVKYLRYHKSEWGQRVHFMRAFNESTTSAYDNGCEFIRLNAAKWVALSLQIRRNGSVVVNSSLRERAIEHLALSLHCLQDTFSPAHTERVTSNKANKPGKILDTRIYKYQNHDRHSDQDYNSGSNNSLSGESAILASTELMLMCIKAVSQYTYLLSEWDDFQNRWLRFDRYLK